MITVIPMPNITLPIYENGLDVSKAEAKTLVLYEQAVAQGHVAAKNNIAALKSNNRSY
jgi:TPR repeat protein